MCGPTINLDLNTVEVAAHTLRADAATIAIKTSLIRLNKKVSAVTSQKTLLMVYIYQINKEHSREREN